MRFTTPQPIIILLMLILSTGHVFSAPDDSTTFNRTLPTAVSYFYEENFIYGNPQIYPVDSSVSRLDCVNEALDKHYNFLGTAISAATPQAFRFDASIYTYTGSRSYDLHLLNASDIAAWRTNKRFTEISYHTGNFKEEEIEFFHTQNITTNWNAGLYFDRGGVRDFMNYSRTFRSRLGVFTSLNSSNKKYNLFIRGILNSIKNGVNGGLESDSLFDNTTVTNLGIKGLAYNIANASENTRTKVFYLSHYYDLGTTIKDSTGNIIHRSPPLRLHHLFSYEQKTFAYIDPEPDSSYYEHFFLDAITYDSTFTATIKNRVAIQLPADSSYTSAFFRRWSSGMFAEFQNVKYWQQTDSTWTNLAIGVNTRFSAGEKSFGYEAEGTYVINGFDDGNYTLQATIYAPDLGFGRLSFSASFMKSSPDLLFRKQYTNNFIWDNTFGDLKMQNFELTYRLNKFRFDLRIGQTLIDNFLYLDNSAMPQQFTKVLPVFYFKLKKLFHFGYWHFDNDILFQRTTNEGVLRMPGWVTDQRFYYQRYYFKNALLMATGISGNYSSSYYADAFMPANAMFYHQNEVMTGGYFRLDLFVNVKIKTARIFIRLENFADDLIERSYYLTPHYPMPGRVFKFGINWRFYDQ